MAAGAWRSVVAACVCALGLGACGDSATSGSDSDQINRLARDLASAAKSKDYDGICELFSAKAKAQLLVAGAFLGGGDCPEIMKKAIALDDSKDGLGKVSPSKVQVRNLKITGTHATGDIIPSDDPKTRFIKEDGRWRLDVDPDEDSSSTSTTSEDGETPAVAAPKLEIPRRGFRSTDNGATFGIEVRNPGTQDADGVEVQVNFVGADGDVLSTETKDLSGIPAGETAYVGGSTDTSGDKPVRMQITAKAESGATAGTVKLPEAGSVKVVRDQYGGVTARVQVTNTLEEPVSAINDVFAVLYDDSGKIVGGMSGYPDNEISPGAKAAVKLSDFGDFPGATAAKAFVDGETG